MVRNGYCNDEANNADCFYDGGDCCGGCVNTDQCSNCLCLDGAAMGVDTSCKCFVLIKYLASKFEQPHQILEYSRIRENTTNASLLARFNLLIFLEGTQWQVAS